MGKGWGGHRKFKGRITAMQVYNVALNQEQIENAMYAADGGKHFFLANGRPSQLRTDLQLSFIC